MYRNIKQTKKGAVKMAHKTKVMTQAQVQKMVEGQVFPMDVKRIEEKSFTWGGWCLVPNLDTVEWKVRRYGEKLFLYITEKDLGVVSRYEIQEGAGQPQTIRQEQAEEVQQEEVQERSQKGATTFKLIKTDSTKVKTLKTLEEALKERERLEKKGFATDLFVLCLEEEREDGTFDCEIGIVQDEGIQYLDSWIVALLTPDMDGLMFEWLDAEGKSDRYFDTVNGALKDFHARRFSEDAGDEEGNELYKYHHNIIDVCNLCGDGGCPSCRPSWFF